VDLHGFGWHFTFFLSPEGIRSKLQSYSHQEFNVPHYTDLENIRRRTSACVDPFDRHDYPTRRLKEDESPRVPEWLTKAAGEGLLPRYWLTGVYDPT